MIESLFKMFGKKLTVDDSLKFLEKHADSVEGVVNVILNKHYDSAKRVLRKLTPATRQRLISLLNDTAP